ncbi:hypothetical protein V5O48_011042 [Marasmius crinis-equi]|uniref:mitogen-activated protein kinase kinase kinase n=1 Tax=Marasmius crinis-equi TaxID=585013 RepID=A0ABR3F6Q1_9AGAR
MTIGYVWALHDFHPENHDEVAFKAGECIEVVEKDELYGDGWWKGKTLAGKLGLFPASFATALSQALPIPDHTPGGQSPGASDFGPSLRIVQPESKVISNPEDIRACLLSNSVGVLDGLTMLESREGWSPSMTADWLYEESQESQDKHYQARCRKALDLIAKRHREFPSSLFVDEIDTVGRFPITGGGFADIYKGVYTRPRSSSEPGVPILCLKVLRVHLESDEQHRNEIIAANVLVAPDHTCRLADFGLARIAYESTMIETTTSGARNGSLRWMAPELFVIPEVSSGIVSSKDSAPCDIYAYGCTVLEIITGKPPFSELTEAQFVARIAMARNVRPRRPAYPEVPWCPDNVWGLLEQCWATDPLERPTANAILRSLGGYPTGIGSSGSVPSQQSTPTAENVAVDSAQARNMERPARSEGLTHLNVYNPPTRNIGYAGRNLTQLSLTKIWNRPVKPMISRLQAASGSASRPQGKPHLSPIAVPTSNPFRKFPQTFIFVHGTLKLPHVLKRVLDTTEPPRLLNATIHGYRIMMACQYPALIRAQNGSRDANTVKGKAWLIETRDQLERLQSYVSGNYRLVGVDIVLDDIAETTRGCSFLWNGSLEGLVEGSFDETQFTD